MRNPKLWEDILHFKFDEPSDVFGFTLRLAKENRWTKDFANRAIEEYRRFMYLAAVSEQMVSPSHIIDQVWHLHLIYTKSYDDLCIILGKKVQHVPATHNPQEGRIYLDARTRTNQEYRKEFGNPPAEIWEQREMTDSLRLPKARVKLRSFIIAGLFAIALLIPALYFVLKPIYVNVGPANFITSYLLLVVISIVVLNLYNRSRLDAIFRQFSADSFVHRLTAAEMIFLQYGRLEAVANGFVNHLVKYGHITTHTDGTIEIAKEQTENSQEEIQIMDLLRLTGRTNFVQFRKKLIARSAFSNIEVCMSVVKKYIHKSAAYHRIFYMNFIITGLLFILGLERVITGIMRDKPITIIAIISFIVLIALIIHIVYINRTMFTTIIPAAYEKKVKASNSLRADWQWNYFLKGSAVFVSAFASIAAMTILEGLNSTNNTAGHRGSSCYSSCGGGGSSCGSSCGGGSCGGCGGGGD